MSEEDAHEEGWVECPHCHVATRPGLTCEWCHGALAPPRAAAAGEPVLPPPPMAPPQPSTVATRAALVHALNAGSYLKNAAVLVAAYVLLTQGLGYLVGTLGGGALVKTLGGGAPFASAGVSAANFAITLAVSLLGAGLVLPAVNVVARWTGGIPLRFRESADWPTGVRELRSVSPISGLRVGLVTGAVWGLVMEVVLAAGMMVPVRGAGGPSIAMGWVFVVVFLSCALGTPAATATLCLVYNLLAQAWGGIRFETAVGQRTEACPMRNDGTARARVAGVGVWQWGLIGGAALVAPAVIVFVAGLAVTLLMQSHVTGPPVGVGSLGMLPIFLIAYPVIGCIAGMVAALIYNLAGVTVGGLEIETSGQRGPHGAGPAERTAKTNEALQDHCGEARRRLRRLPPRPEGGCRRRRRYLRGSLGRREIGDPVPP